MPGTRRREAQIDKSRPVSFDYRRGKALCGWTLRG
jgi:hypothetical protein